VIAFLEKDIRYMIRRVSGSHYYRETSRNFPKSLQSRAHNQVWTKEFCVSQNRRLKLALISLENIVVKSIVVTNLINFQ